MIGCWNEVIGVGRVPGDLSLLSTYAGGGGTENASFPLAIDSEDLDLMFSDAGRHCRFMPSSYGVLRSGANRTDWGNTNGVRHNMT